MLDEADTFATSARNSLPAILQELPEETQSLLFSATYPDDVKEWADYMAPEAVKIQKDAKDLTLETVTQVKQ